MLNKNHAQVKPKILFIKQQPTYNTLASILFLTDQVYAFIWKFLNIFFSHCSSKMLPLICYV